MNDASTADFEMVPYLYVWAGEESEGAVKVINGMLGDRHHVEVTIAQAIAEKLHGYGKVVFFGSRQVNASLPFERNTEVAVTVQSPWYQPFQLSVYDAV